jgi:hypothetical protein
MDLSYQVIYLKFSTLMRGETRPLIRNELGNGPYVERMILEI